jgi:pyridoxine 5-phosphate synthase
VTHLSVNLNKVALLRNQRPLDIPNVQRMALIAIGAGAHGITVHPRPDERHVRASDVHELGRLLKDHPRIEYNIEGNPMHNTLDLVLELRPHQFTMVPDEHGAVTSDHGWNLAPNEKWLRPIIERVKAAGVRVSLFMDADPDAMARARALGADRVELYTEPYARAFGTPDEGESLHLYAAAARAAQQAGLGVNAGHDLNRDNLPAFIAAVPGVLEVSIGHALVADALELGMDATVRAYLAALGGVKA